MVLKFTNGSVLQLGYCDSLSDTSRYQGTSRGLLLVDELTLMLPGSGPAQRKAMRDGDWSAFDGQFFSEWSHHRHIVARDAITLAPAWRPYCGTDFGYAAPFCALWGAVDNDGRWWLYPEIYEKGL